MHSVLYLSCIYGPRETSESRELVWFTSTYLLREGDGPGPAGSGLVYEATYVSTPGGKCLAALACYID